MDKFVIRKKRALEESTSAAINRPCRPPVSHCVTQHVADQQINARLHCQTRMSGTTRWLQSWKQVARATLPADLDILAGEPDDRLLRITRIRRPRITCLASLPPSSSSPYSLICATSSGQLLSLPPLDSLGADATFPFGNTLTAVVQPRARWQLSSGAIMDLAAAPACSSAAAMVACVGVDRPQVNLCSFSGSGMLARQLVRHPSRSLQRSGACTGLSAVTFLPSQPHCVAACGGNRVSIWDVRAPGNFPLTLLRAPDFGTSRSELTCLTADPDGTVLYAGSSSGHISVWDIRTAVRSRQPGSIPGTDTSARPPLSSPPARAGAPAHATASEGGAVVESQTPSPAGVRTLISSPSPAAEAPLGVAVSECGEGCAPDVVNTTAATTPASLQGSRAANGLSSAAARVAGIPHPSASQPSSSAAASAAAAMTNACSPNLLQSPLDSANLSSRLAPASKSTAGTPPSRYVPAARKAPGSAPARQAAAFGGTRPFSSPAPSFGTVGRTSRAMSFGSEDGVPPLHVFSTAQLLRSVPTLEEQAGVSSSSVQWLSFNPHTHSEIAFHLANGWTGVINLSTLRLTHIHCPPTPWHTSSASGMDPHLHSDTQFDSFDPTSLTPFDRLRCRRSPAWCEHERDLLAVPSASLPLLHLLPLGPHSPHLIPTPSHKLTESMVEEATSLPLPPSNSDILQLSEAVRGTHKRRRAALSLPLLPAVSVPVSSPLVSVCAVRPTTLLCSAVDGSIVCLRPTNDLHPAKEVDP